MNSNTHGTLVLKADCLISILARAAWILGLMTITLGLIYPALMTGLAKVIFPHQASGSIVIVENRAVGSSLIGQDFTGTPYFQSRPSASATPYDGRASGGSNDGPGKDRLIEQINQRVAYWQLETGSETRPPVDLLTSSASGLDPHITVHAARYQIPAVSRKTSIPEDVLEQLIERHSEKSLFGGPDFINVLTLNMHVRSIHRNLSN